MWVYLPDLASVRRALADTMTVCILPSINMRRFCRFGFHVRLLDLIEKVRPWPKLVVLPVIAHFAMIF